jgi:putative addiction module CopG family antidote
VRNVSIRVSLPPDLARFVRAQVGSGAFASASDVVRVAVRRFALHDQVALLAAPADACDVQEQPIDRSRARAAIWRLRQLRKGFTIGSGSTAKDLRDDGRR